MLQKKSSIWITSWSLAVAAGLFMAIFAAYPQIKLHFNQDGNWQGHYAYNDIDEVAYAAYLKALIDGRPRKNDPYSGKDDSAAEPQPESLFSIQFAAPYTVAIPARVLGVSAPMAMTLAGVLAAFLAAAVCFWLLFELFGNSLLAFSGALAVFCLGALIAGEGAVGEVLGTGFSYPYFPYLRRYVPAVPFPLFFFLLFSSVKMLEAEKVRSRVLWAVGIFLSFAFVLFSYFYIWTAAAAWLFILTTGVFLFKPDDWKKKIYALLVLGAACMLPLAVYAYLLSNRGATMDNVQLLAKSHAPDLMRLPFLVSAVVLVCLSVLALLKRVDFKSTRFLFAMTTAVVPIILFNQQVITGHSLQPIHYQVFIGNYIAGLAVVCLIGLIYAAEKDAFKRFTGMVALVVAACAVVWGFVESHYTVRVLDDANIARDRGFRVGEFLTEESRKSADPFRDTVFSTSSILADDLPTIAPQNVLWARHQHVFSGLTWDQNKERYYQQIYYQDLDDVWLNHQLRSGNFVAMIALFGWGRHTDRLTTEAKPLTGREIDEEVARYRKYIEEFDSSKAQTPLLSYLVIPGDSTAGFQNLNKWYEVTLLKIDSGFKIFRLKIK